MVNNPSIAVNAFPMCILTLLSVDKILLPRYLKWSTDTLYYNQYYSAIPFVLDVIMLDTSIEILKVLRYYFKLCSKTTEAYLKNLGSRRK